MTCKCGIVSAFVQHASRIDLFSGDAVHSDQRLEDHVLLLSAVLWARAGSSE